MGITTDHQSYVYVTDFGNDEVYKFNQNGKPLLKFGSSGTEDGEFDAPLAVAVNQRSEIYVLEFNNHRVQKFESEGNFLLMWGGEGSAEGQLLFPGDLALDLEENVLGVGHSQLPFT